MSTLCTHVLDAALGVPAVGLAVTLRDPQGRQLTRATTDADGRVRFDLDLGAGTTGWSSRPAPGSPPPSATRSSPRSPCRSTSTPSRRTTTWRCC